MLLIYKFIILFPTVSLPTPTYQKGNWVAVEYDDIVYPGEITNIWDNQVEVIVMHPVSTNVYKWPATEDKHIYPLCDILKCILPPIPMGSRAAFFRFEDL